MKSVDKLKVCVIGLGYVGLPLAVAFGQSKKFKKIYGFDINLQRISELKRGVDVTNEVNSVEIKDARIKFIDHFVDLLNAKIDVFIVTVPTPVDHTNKPDLFPLKSACKTIGEVCVDRKDVLVVFESTVAPGTTMNECLDWIQIASQSTIKNLQIAFSPERINPGDKEHTITKMTKIVSGDSVETLKLVSEIYKCIVPNVYEATSVEVAEAAKILENTQRDINIALINEMTIICQKMGISIYDVLDAAKTKWNFLPFYPGLVGGHCIGVDPYYLVSKAAELGVHADVITAGRRINDEMAIYMAQWIFKELVKQYAGILPFKVRVLGVTFKPGVSDIRNSKVFDLIKELEHMGVRVLAMDPYANSKDVYDEYGVQLEPHPSELVDAVIIAVKHSEFEKMTDQDFKNMMVGQCVVIDIPKALDRDKLTRHGGVKYITL